MTSAEKDFLKFPAPVQSRMRAALEVAATGEMADIAKPLKGMDTGVYELRVAYRTDAFRAIYAVRIGTGRSGVAHRFGPVGDDDGREVGRGCLPERDGTAAHRLNRNSMTSPSWTT